MDQVTVAAPATVSNVVCGFDCLGFALAEPFDLVTVRKRFEPGIAITHLDDFRLPTDPELNVAGVALSAMLAAIHADFGLEVEIEKGIKPGSGIGSSSASSCGAVVALNHLLGEPFEKLDLVLFAMEGERLASGSAHADNAAPCIYGGFTLVRSTDPLDIVTLNFPPLFVTVIHPQIEIKTADARAILPAKVSLADAVNYWSNTGAFIAALHTGDFNLMARAMDDQLIEPARKSLIPNFDQLKDASLTAGAIGGGISGSGPSVFMLSKTQKTASLVGAALAEVYAPTNIEFNIYLSDIAPGGVRQISS